MVTQTPVTTGAVLAAVDAVLAHRAGLGTNGTLKTRENKLHVTAVRTNPLPCSAQVLLGYFHLRILHATIFAKPSLHKVTCVNSIV